MAKKKPKLVVPYVRQLRSKNQKGDDVLAIRRALAQAGFLKWRDWEPRDEIYNDSLKTAVRKFQKKHSLKVDGVYGPVTHKRLVGFRRFDAYGAMLMQRAKKARAPKSEGKRRVIVATAMFGYYHRDEMHYMPVRPMEDMNPPPNINSSLDCSEYATWCYKAAGAPDPNGYGYSGWGYTGSMIEHGKETGSPKPGDLVIYGTSRWNTTHVAIYIGHGKVASMGSDPGPLILPMDYRDDRVSIRSYLP